MKKYFKPEPPPNRIVNEDIDLPTKREVFWICVGIMAVAAFLGWMYHLGGLF